MADGLRGAAKAVGNAPTKGGHPLTLEVETAPPDQTYTFDKTTGRWVPAPTRTGKLVPGSTSPPHKLPYGDNPPRGPIRER